MATTAKARPPVGLKRGGGGAKLWRDVIAKFELRPDELRILEDACFQADLVDKIRDALKGKPTMILGSMGQQVVNPLIGELRQSRTALATLIKQLHLPDDQPGAGATEGGRSTAARTMANARWSTRGA